MVGLAAYSNLLRNANKSDEAIHYETLNRQFVEYWLKNALVCCPNTYFDDVVYTVLAYLCVVQYTQHVNVILQILCMLCLLYRLEYARIM